MNTVTTPARLVATLLLAALGASAHAEDSIEQQVRQLTLEGTRTVGQARVEVEVGQLDPRLHLAPCQKVQPYLPQGGRLWGKSRIGLRCVQGPSPWNVFMPITVKVYGVALVAAVPLPTGSVLKETDLAQAEVDLAEGLTPAVTDMSQALGRTLTRALNPGEGVYSGNLRQRQWFAAGETVKLVASGAGFSVSSDAVAITPGFEGQPARVRTESGRMLTGAPTGDHTVEATNP